MVYFYDAHLFVDESSLEKYFSQFGQVFRTLHFSDPITNDGVKSSHDLSAVNKVSDQGLSSLATGSWPVLP